MALPAIAFEDIWREHKRFIVAVAAGLVAFLGGLSTVSSIDDAARRTQARNREMESDIRALSDAISGREGQEAGIARALEREVAPETREAVEFAARPEYALKSGDSPFIVYRQAIERVETVRAEALRRNIGCPEDLGFVKDPPEDRVHVYLAGADLAERALQALVQVEARRVESFRPGEAEYVRIVDEPEPPPGGGAGAGDAGGGAPEPPVLRRLPLRFTAVGSVDALENLLSGFQRPRSALELGALKVTRAGEGLLRFDVEVAALTLVPAAEMRAAKASAAGGRKPPPRPGGGRLR